MLGLEKDVYGNIQTYNLYSLYSNTYVWYGMSSGNGVIFLNRHKSDRFKH